MTSSKLRKLDERLRDFIDQGRFLRKRAMWMNVKARTKEAICEMNPHARLIQRPCASPSHFLLEIVTFIKRGKVFLNELCVYDVRGQRLRVIYMMILDVARLVISGGDIHGMGYMWMLRNEWRLASIVKKETNCDMKRQCIQPGYVSVE